MALPPFLQQALGMGPVPTDPMAADEIVVEARAPRGPDIYEDDRIPPSPQMMEEMVPRQGMFGTKGTLRDILGVVGDAFLTQSGNERVYAPQRQREKLGDAMYGFAENPLAAIERMALVDPAAAQAARENYQQQQLRQAQQESLGAQRESLATDRLEGNIKDLRNWGARLLQGAGNNPELQNRALSILQAQADRLGVSMEDLGLPADLSPEELTMYSAGDMTVNQQQNLPLRERTVRTGERNADTNASRAATSARQGDARIGNTAARNRVLERQGDERIEIAREKAAGAADKPARRPLGKSGGQTKYVYRNGKLVPQ